MPYLVEREGTSCENLPETHAVIKELRRRLDDAYPGKMLLAEANQWPADVRDYFGDGDEFNMAFHFPLMPRMFMAVKLEDRKPIIEILEQTPQIPDNCQWCIFLRNHDELTLEMVTDIERDYMYDSFANDKTMRINLGIRRRLAPMMENDRRRIELLNGLLLSMPGTPIIYYGDEIGMGDNIYLGDRNGVRTPMQWNGGWNAGFSSSDPERLYSPLISNPVYGYQAVNVDSQRRSEHSLLSWTKSVIQTRNSFRVFSRGSIDFLSPSNHRVLGLRASVGRGESAGGQQLVELGAGGRAASAKLQRAYPDRNVWQEPISEDRRAPIFTDPGPIPVFLVPLKTHLNSPPAECRFLKIPGCNGITAGADFSWPKTSFSETICFAS